MSWSHNGDLNPQVWNIQKSCILVSAGQLFRSGVGIQALRVKIQPGFLSTQAENGFQGKWRSCLVGRSNLVIQVLEVSVLRSILWTSELTALFRTPCFDTKLVFCGWNQLKKAGIFSENEAKKALLQVVSLPHKWPLKGSVKTQPKFCVFRSFEDRTI